MPSKPADISIRYKGRQVWVPQCWERLSKKQFLAIHKILLDFPLRLEQQIAAVRPLIGMSRRDYLQLTDEQLYDLIVMTGFIYGEDIVMARNPLPRFWLGGILYEGVDMSLEHFTMEEYGRIDVSLYGFSQDDSMKHLYDIAAVMYRPVRVGAWVKNRLTTRNIDVRIQHLDNVDQRSRRFQKYMPHHLLEACIFIYHAIHQYFKTEFPLVYERPGDDEDTTAQESEKRNDYGWAGVIIDMAGPRFGTIEQTLKRPCIDILPVLQREIEQAREREFNARFSR